MSKLSDAFSKAKDSVSDFIEDALIKKELSSEEQSIVTWENSAGQLVQSRLHDRHELEGLAQAAIDSYAAYHDEATPESRLNTARSISEEFSNVARGAHVVKDVPNGDGRYRFTVKTERNSSPKLV